MMIYKKDYMKGFFKNLTKWWENLITLTLTLLIKNENDLSQLKLNSCTYY